MLLLVQVRTYKHVTRPLPMGSLDEAEEDDDEALPSSRSREQMLETWCVWGLTEQNRVHCSLVHCMAGRQMRCNKCRLWPEHTLLNKECPGLKSIR
jgi:hypothetical protein